MHCIKIIQKNVICTRIFPCSYFVKKEVWTYWLEYRLLMDGFRFLNFKIAIKDVFIIIGKYSIFIP